MCGGPTEFACILCMKACKQVVRICASRYCREVHATVCPHPHLGWTFTLPDSAWKAEPGSPSYQK